MRKRFLTILLSVLLLCNNTIISYAAESDAKRKDVTFTESVGNIQPSYLIYVNSPKTVKYASNDIADYYLSAGYFTIYRVGDLAPYESDVNVEISTDSIETTNNGRITTKCYIENRDFYDIVSVFSDYYNYHEDFDNLYTMILNNQIPIGYTQFKNKTIPYDKYKQPVKDNPLLILDGKSISSSSYKLVNDKVTIQRELLSKGVNITKISRTDSDFYYKYRNIMGYYHLAKSSNYNEGNFQYALRNKYEYNNTTYSYRDSDGNYNTYPINKVLSFYLRDAAELVEPYVISRDSQEYKDNLKYYYFVESNISDDDIYKLNIKLNFSPVPITEAYIP